jgi:hypothetical protein
MSSSFRLSQTFAALLVSGTPAHLAFNQPYNFVFNGFFACPAEMDGYHKGSGANPLCQVYRLGKGVIIAMRHSIAVIGICHI